MGLAAMPPRLPAAHPRHEAHPTLRQGGEVPDVPGAGKLAREALDLLEDGPAVRRSMLEEGAALYDFLGERMPTPLTEWHARRDNLGRDP
jgi:hypothetical protein